MTSESKAETEALDQQGDSKPSDSTKAVDSLQKPADGETDKDEKSSQLRECFRIERALVPIKLFYLSFIGGIGCVLPYVAVFLKQNGLSPQQIGLISGLRPVVGFISGPVWGALGDRFNIRRLLLLISVTGWLIFYVGFYFIPPPPRINTCPERAEPHRKRYIRSVDLEQRNSTLNNSATSWFDTDSEEALKEMSPKGATLVFPSYHPNSPSSMFGHTLIRIDHESGSPLRPSGAVAGDGEQWPRDVSPLTKTKGADAP